MGKISYNWIGTNRGVEEKGVLAKHDGDGDESVNEQKCLMSKTMVLHVRFESWYISLPSSAKQQREMTKFYVFWRT